VSRRLTLRIYLVTLGQLLAVALLFIFGQSYFGGSPAAYVASLVVAMVGVGLSSVVFARTLAAPLGRIASVAREFGDGHLDARVRLNRDDELGDVAQAVDELADRVTRMLLSQKELLANVSHELRTPLARIRVALDLAAEGDATAAREALADITEDWVDLERLVEDVLAAARFDLGKGGGSAPLRIAPTDILPILDKAVTRFKNVHPSRHLVYDMPGNLPSVPGDASMLRRVVDNLLDNARKYSEPGSVVRLRATLEGNFICIAVIDQGIGIDSADLPNLFTPFFRTDRSRARTTGGIGMGLALARRIVEAHGGTIEVTSRRGAGTTLVCRLPVGPRDPALAKE
jgi:signal transduction histidine kinase